MRQEQSVLRRISEKVDLPAEILPYQGEIVISGSREVSINAHDGVGTYSTEEIRVRFGHGWVVISGSRLEIARMNALCIIIRGHVARVELEGVE